MTIQETRHQLRAFRKEQGISAKEAAEKYGIDFHHIYRAETTGNIKLIEKVANAYGLQLKVDYSITSENKEKFIQYLGIKAAEYGLIISKRI